MYVEDGKWYLKGIDRKDPRCIHTVEELEDYINEAGFLPFFSNEIEGFSAEERTDPRYWWSGNEKTDPWCFREIIARRGKIAYGKFFDKRAGFISMEWLPYFVNARRGGYDFDARWEDGLAERREKSIMDVYLSEGPDGETEYSTERILSTALKKKCGFGKEGSRNFPGILTGLQMQTYLVISDFERRRNKKGEEFGMPVSILLPPEAIWGREQVCSAYSESPVESWQRIYNHVKEMYEDATEKDIFTVIGKKPE